MRHSKRWGLQAILVGLVGLTLGLGAISTPARAAITFDPDGNNNPNGTGSLTPIDIGGFEFTVDNALAVGAVKPGGLQTGDLFRLYYHATLSGVTGPPPAGGSLPDPAGLKSTFEITAVASALEAVIDPGSAQGATTFGVAPNQAADGGQSFIELYFDTARNANSLTGTGYNDGILIFRGTPSSLLRNDGMLGRIGSGTELLDQFGTDTPDPTQTISAFGSATISAFVDDFSSEFFRTAPGQIELRTRYDTPFVQTNPSERFAGQRNTVIGTGGSFPGILPDLGATNGISGPNFQFQTQASATLAAAPVQAIPEPSSLTLMGLGLACTLGFGWRRLRRANADDRDDPHA